MTISTGVLVLIIVALAWKMKGAQLPHVFLGMILMKATTAGSFIDQLAAMGLDLVNTVMNALASGVGQGNIV